MSRPSVARSTVDGFDVVSVDTGALALAMMPELGGKISSLRDLRSGREWLWRHPRMAYKRVAYGGSYIAEADTGGWDECFPTVAPCGYPSAPWSGTRLPDRGELWSQSAALDVTEAGGMIQVRTRWQGIALPYTFERAITLMARSSSLRCAYAVTNHADAPLLFIWSAHPLLAIEPGMRLPPPRVAQLVDRGRAGSISHLLECGSWRHRR